MDLDQLKRREFSTLRGGWLAAPGTCAAAQARSAALAEQELVVALLQLSEFNGGDRPLAFVTYDGNSQPVEFIKPNVFHRPRLSIA